jgi:hypothetical protein
MLAVCNDGILCNDINANGTFFLAFNVKLEGLLEK